MIIVLKERKWFQERKCLDRERVSSDRVVSTKNYLRTEYLRPKEWEGVMQLSQYPVGLKVSAIMTTSIVASLLHTVSQQWTWQGTQYSSAIINQLGIYWKIFGIRRSHWLGSFSFIFQLVVMTFYENAIYLYVAIYFYSAVHFKILLMIKPLNLSTNLPAGILLMSLSW